jgi:hypothetical protein
MAEPVNLGALMKAFSAADSAAMDERMAASATVSVIFGMVASKFDSTDYRVEHVTGPKQSTVINITALNPDPRAPYQKVQLRDIKGLEAEDLKGIESGPARTISVSFDDGFMVFPCTPEMAAEHLGNFHGKTASLGLKK